MFNTETSAMAVIWNTSNKKCILSASDIKSMFYYYYYYYISFQDMEYFFEFFVSVKNHYHINRLYLFWDSFEWFCLQISSDAKYFVFSSRHCDQGFIVVILYYFQIWNIKEYNIIIIIIIIITIIIIIIIVISSHIGPMYIETPYINGLQLFWEILNSFVFK